jgi:D-glycero-alpha-D-manno-heptose-7-phosphate kinase
LNVATSLKAKVKISRIDFDGVEIISRDYNSTTKFQSSDFTASQLQNNFFEHFTFIAYILDFFNVHKNVCIELESGSPPGAGLGGSSSMGVTLYKALCEFTQTKMDRIEAISRVNAFESKILDSGPAGYQDYYPALFGGILGLVPKPGKVEVDQLFNDELKNELESTLTLVYSGDTRLSGINNWEVYKAFFNKDKFVRAGLAEIAVLSHVAYQLIKSNKHNEIFKFIGLEGEERRKLFPNIITPKMDELRTKLKEINSEIGLKVCGAGGGGCFLISHPKKEKLLVSEMINKCNMREMEFNISRPL